MTCRSTLVQRRLAQEGESLFFLLVLWEGGRHHQKPRAREVHHDIAGDVVAPSDGDALSRERHDAALDRNLAVVVRPDVDEIADLAAVRIVGIASLGGLRRAGARELQRFGARYLAPRAVTDAAHPRVPAAHLRKFGKELVDEWKVRADVPDVHIGVDIEKAWGAAGEPWPVAGELRLDPLHMRAVLVAHLRDRRFHRRNVELRTSQSLAVLDKTLRHLVGE